MYTRPLFNSQHNARCIDQSLAWPQTGLALCMLSYHAYNICMTHMAMHVYAAYNVFMMFKFPSSETEHYKSRSTQPPVDHR